MISNTQAFQKLVFSITLPVIDQFKKQVPARKRSAVIEALMIKYLAEEKERAAWDATNQLRNLYTPGSGPVQLGSVDWLKQDRASH